MLVHSVYFWLKKELTSEQVRSFEAELGKLTRLPNVRHGFVGKPAATHRPIIDRTYSFALTLVFDNLAGHDAYQADPDHGQFVRKCDTYWSAIRVYDAE